MKSEEKRKLALLSARNQMLFYMYVLVFWSIYDWIVEGYVGPALIIFVVGLAVYYVSYILYRRKNRHEAYDYQKERQRSGN
ncbi:hypothetical protein [Tuberibacillus sp. Marseille-P3662]|uniref:hypothetical protein n=1 Tax=Tuberibacillus sp. Marseille-P3662 TaxID=1965358 RepID=UPI000A1C8815|nr:hypothetical protein [Tuberibacillus sp. Marseille-P3662]